MQLTPEEEQVIFRYRDLVRTLYSYALAPGEFQEVKWLSPILQQD
ncbi:MAG: hypothetical protein RMK16_08600 [Acidobacteriota bacterium]|nr:hypothetical protein [Acidobacteriota bacterium]